MPLLTHIEIGLREDPFKTLMVGLNRELISQEVVTLDLQNVYDC